MDTMMSRLEICRAADIPVRIRTMGGGMLGFSKVERIELLEYDPPEEHFSDYEPDDSDGGR